jgi:hypothetical protein
VSATATNGRSEIAALTATTSLAEALAAFQAEAPKFPKRKTARVQTKAGGEYSYKYADLGDILPIVGPLMAKHGLSWSAKPGRDETGELALFFTLRHVSGETDSGDVPLGVPKGCKPQEIGSALTYMRRYAQVAQLNLDVDEDDDGQTAQAAGNGEQPTSQPTGRPPLASDAQRGMLQGRGQHLPRGDFANVLLMAAGEPPRVWADEDTAVRWIKGALDRLPAKYVDAALAGIAGAAAEGSQA